MIFFSTVLIIGIFLTITVIKNIKRKPRNTFLEGYINNSTVKKKKKTIPFTEQEIIDFSSKANNTIKIIQNILNNNDEGEIHRVFRQQNPTLNDKPIYEFNDELNEVDLTSDLFEIEEFEFLLSQKKIVNKPSNLKNELPRGRILGFEIGLSTIDGAPISESNGFVDYYDIPPYDTWVYLKPNYLSSKETILFCWIPKEYETYMQNAMDVEIFDAYFWLDNQNPTLNDMLLTQIATHNKSYN